MEGKSMKLYIEEIPVENSNSTDPQREESLNEGIESIQLKDGGELRSVRFAEEFGSLHEHSNQKIDGIHGSVSATKFNIPKENGSPPACGSSSICRVKNSLFVFGGANRERQHYNDVWRFDLLNKTWIKLGATNISGEPPSERSGHSAVVYGTNIYIYGGMNLTETSWYDDLYVLETHVDSMVDKVRWRKIVTENPPQSRAEHSASLVGDSTMLVFGGSSPMQGEMSDVHLLDLADLENEDTVPSWKVLRCKGTLPEPRELHSAVILYPESNAEKPSTNNNNMNTKTKWKFPVNYPLNYGTVVKKVIPIPQRSDREEAQRHKAIGNEYYVKKEYELALEAYTKAIEKDPTQHLLYGNRAACYLSMKKPKESLEDSMQAIRLNPKWSKGYLRESAALKELGRINEAMHAIQHSIELASTPNERTTYTQKMQKLQQIAHKCIGTDITPSNGPKLVIFGGRGASGVLDDIVMLDIENAYWMPKVSTPFHRCGHVATAINDTTMNVFGGTNQSLEVFSNSMLYDIATGMWTECKVHPKVPEKRFAQAVCSMESLPLKNVDNEFDAKSFAIFGGVNLEKDLDDIWILTVEKMV